MRDLWPHFLPLSLRAADLLVASIWQGALLVAATALGLRFAAKLSAAGRARVLALVLVVVILLTLLPLLPSYQADAAVSTVAVRPLWALLVCAGWCAAVLYRAARLLWSGLRVWLLARRATELEAPRELVVLLTDSRGARLCLSHEVDRPSVAGLFRPRILFPPELFASLTAPEMTQVLLHEREHLRRYDDWWNALQQVCLVLLPFHPALLWLDRQMSRERELACDDAVLKTPGARTAYASCLVKIAEDSMLRRQLDLALGLLGSRARSSDLVLRVQRILRSVEGPEVPWRSRVLASTGVAVAIVAGVSLVASHPLPVRFGQISAPLPMMARVQMPVPPADEVHATEFRSTPGAFAARPVLTKAAMTLGAGLRPVLQVQPASARRRNLMHSRSAVAPASRNEWRAAVIRPEPQLVLTRSFPAQTFYAAVPWQGGWLLVQL